MTTTIRTYFLRCVALAALASLVLCVSSTHAGIVVFNDIVQSTQTPDDPDDLYGVPDTSVPNKLNFRPQSFAATAIGAGGVDVTDGFLTFSVRVDDPNLTWATGITLMEGGSWSLIPSPPTQNVAGVRGNGSIRITEVDGDPVAEPVFPIVFEENFDASDTPPDSANWTSGFSQGFGDVNGRVTAFDVLFNNRLFALSEAGFAFIDKKDISFMVQTEMIPEPTTAVLAFMAFAGLGLVVRRNNG